MSHVSTSLTSNQLAYYEQETASLVLAGMQSDAARRLAYVRMLREYLPVAHPIHRYYGARYLVSAPIP